MRAGPLVFAAGQLASDFKTGVPAEARKHPNFPFYGSDIKLQSHFVLKNLARTFAAAGSSLDHVVKAQVFLTDLNNFAPFRRSLARIFQGAAAAHDGRHHRSLVKDTLIEIDLIGYVPGADVTHRVVTSDNPKPLANYSEAVRVGDLVYAAGQLASDFRTGVPPEARKHANFPFYGSDIALQTEYIFEKPAKNLRGRRVIA